MEYNVTARKWRPQTFQEVIGQEHLTKALKNAIISGKIPHAYLFSGARGVGKTTTARILAKALNCLNLNDGEPCNKCRSCIEITNGYSLDVIEIDGASNRGIDNIREIRDNVSFLPISTKYKVYIIDEVHMLTTEASNALLKTLEEPPSHVIFILATTEPFKVLPTIRSRCQHYIFKKISLKNIIKQLKTICDNENIKYTEEALYLIASAGDGSLRDSESILDQIVLYSNGNITEQAVIEVLGIPEINYYIEIINCIKNNDAIQMMKTIKNYLDNIGDIKLFTKGLINLLRNALLVKKLDMNDDLLDLTEYKYNQIKQIFNDFSFEEITKMLQLLLDLYKDLKGEMNERILLEISIFKLLDYKNIIPLSQIRNDILQLLDKLNKINIEKSQVLNFKSEKIQEPYFNKQSTTSETPVLKSENIYNKEINEVNIKNSIMRILQRNKIMQNFIQDITKINYDKFNINLEINNEHASEYLKANKERVENELYKEYNQKINLNIIYIKLNKNEKITENNKIESNIEKYINNNQKNQKVNEPIVEKIIEIFDGKLLE